MWGIVETNEDASRRQKIEQDLRYWGKGYGQVMYTNVTLSDTKMPACRIPIIVQLELTLVKQDVSARRKKNEDMRSSQES